MYTGTLYMGRAVYTRCTGSSLYIRLAAYGLYTGVLGPYAEPYEPLCAELLCAEPAYVLGAAYMWSRLYSDRAAYMPSMCQRSPQEEGPAQCPGLVVLSND